MDARYGDPLTVADLARAAGLSAAHFSREFRKTYGESPHQYLRTRRLERAAHQLRTTDRNVTEICLAVGYSSLGSFTTAFGRHFGCSPLAMRNAAHATAPTPVHVPACVVRAYTRPANRTFREAAPTATSVTSPPSHFPTSEAVP